ncbi:MAG: T9SS type A sorting domain-containing protein [Bacteroidota bacterium]|jgi:hypothetical protein
MKHTFSRTFAIIITALLPVGVLFGQGADIPGAITSDENGYVYVAGSTVNSSGQTSIVIVAYDQDGNLWKEFSVPPNTIGPATAVRVALIDSLIVAAGTATTASGGADIFAAGFDRPTIVSVGSPPLAKQGFQLEQNYPNPLRIGSVATINYSIPVAGGVRLSVVDMAGREVAVLVDGFHDPGKYQTQFRPSSLPTGAYLYVLTSSAISEARKLKLIR